MRRIWGNTQEFFFCSLIRLKPGLHIVVRIAEHACDDALKRILKLSTYRLKIFLVKYQNLWPLQRFRVKTISVQLKIHVRDYVLAILTTYMETRLKSCSQLKWKERWWTTLTRIIQGVYEQGLYKVIAGAGELSKDCHKSLNKKEGGKLLPFWLYHVQYNWFIFTNL